MKDNKEQETINQMDIFTKGFVKPIPIEEAIEKIDVEEIEKEQENNVNYDQNQEINKNPKSNNEKMKEKVDELINELDIQDEEREKKQRKKRKIKNTLLIIGIFIEIIIICFLAYIKFFKETYYSTLTCSSTTQNNDNYTITMKNIYYFDKENNVAKTENNVVYIFENKDSYNKYKENYISSDIKDYKGIVQKSIFDDNNYAYQNKTIYIYSKLRKNKNVIVNNDNLIANIKGRDEPITIYMENYVNVLSRNEESGFICE